MDALDTMYSYTDADRFYDADMYNFELCTCKRKS